MDIHFLKESVTPLHAFLDEEDLITDEGVASLVRADLIIGFDVMSERGYLLHGRELLRERQASGKEVDLVTVVIGFDEGTQEEKILQLAIEVVKRRG